MNAQLNTLNANIEMNDVATAVVAVAAWNENALSLLCNSNQPAMNSRKEK